MTEPRKPFPSTLAVMSVSLLRCQPLVLFASILRVPEGEGCALPGIKALGIVSA